MRTKTAVLYARVSSKEQEEGYSIDAQLKALRDYAGQKGFAVIHEFVEAETAKRAGRKEFDQMVHLVQAESVTAILVEKTDKIYRNLKDRVTVDELRVELHLVKEGEVLSRDSKSHAKFIHDIKLVVAKNYIDNLSEETKKGMIEKARQGIYPTRGPLGYLNVEQGSRRVLAVDPVRGPIMTRLFEVYAAGRTSVRQLTKVAFEFGLRSKRGNRVSKSALAHMLQNPVYCGIVSWAGETHAGIHEPLVPLDVFKHVQDVMQGRIKNNAGYGSKDFPYRGLFRCGYCGCSLTAELKKGRYVYYHCTGNKGPCPKPFVREEIFTQHFVELLTGFSIPHEIAEWMASELGQNATSELARRDTQIVYMKREEKKLTARLERLYLDKIEGDVSLDLYRTLKEKSERDLAEVRLSLTRISAPTRPQGVDGLALLELARTACSRFESASGPDKRELLSHLCSNCVFTEGNVQVSLKEPFNMLLTAGGSGAKPENWLPQ